MSFRKIKLEDQELETIKSLEFQIDKRRSAKYLSEQGLDRWLRRQLQYGRSLKNNPVAYEVLKDFMVRDHHQSFQEEVEKVISK